MSTVSAPARPRPASAPPALERHGKCGLTLSIGGTRYRLCPYPPPQGLKVVWTLKKVQADPLKEPVAYAVADDGREAHCTCPDHEMNGATCKHIMALRALGLVPRPRARKPRPARPSRPMVAAPIVGTGGFEICDRCGVDFDPVAAGHPLLCRSCASEGGAL